MTAISDFPPANKTKYMCERQYKNQADVGRIFVIFFIILGLEKS